jgi:predicted nucleotidyltransferase component of viral defense system
MIENFYLDEWRQQVPWIPLYQVEQDLIISRALVNLYEQPIVRKSLVFRGGTALNKIYFNPPERYSEDLDFVQIQAAPIGQTMDAIRAALDHWLGEPKRKLTERGVKLVYQYQTQENRKGKLKIEINTTEHYHVLDLVAHEFSVQSRWFSGKTLLKTYQLNELMGSKLRALYQRRKGRDLFDIWVAIQKEAIQCDQVIEIFNHYCQQEGKRITRSIYEKNLYEKSLQQDFQIDVSELIVDPEEWSFSTALELVRNELISRLPGNSWVNPIHEELVILEG